jgi:hypothetical protein
MQDLKIKIWIGPSEPLLTPHFSAETFDTACKNRILHCRRVSFSFFAQWVAGSSFLYYYLTGDQEPVGHFTVVREQRLNKTNPFLGFTDSLSMVWPWVEHGQEGTRVILRQRILISRTRCRESPRWWSGQTSTQDRLVCKPIQHGPVPVSEVRCVSGRGSLGPCVGQNWQFWPIQHRLTAVMMTSLLVLARSPGGEGGSLALVADLRVQLCCHIRPVCPYWSLSLINVCPYWSLRIINFRK